MFDLVGFVFFLYIMVVSFELSMLQGRYVAGLLLTYSK